jgi:hypothetical protein
MNLKTFARLGRRGRRLVWGGAITGLMLAAGTTAIGDVSPEAKRLANQDRASLSLFSGPTAVLQGNQIQCGIVNTGDVCSNVFNSPTGGGGFWPTGSQNQYIFNTGLQIAGIMDAAGGPWANDTVGAYFFDARGTQQHGTALTDVFNSLDLDDLANWPAEGFVLDADLFQPVLVGRATASQQDSWVQYWDGDPARNAARAHPMGIKVTQRSLAWNYPAGNESLIYFIYNFQNVTDDPVFQQLNEATFFAGADALPDGGITLNEIYAAFSTDMDITLDAGANLSTAVLPFDLGISYHGGFAAPEFSYPSDLFFPPFFTNAPGLIGVKYLRSPIDPVTQEQVGLTLFSITINGAGPGEVPDAVGDRQLWRYLSGKVSPAQGDAPCSITAHLTSSDPAQVERAMCFIAQTAGDTRFYQASGPATLAPGDDGTIVVAYIAAPTLQFLPGGGTTGISVNDPNDSANPPGTPSFHPGFPSARGCPVGGAVPGSCTEVDNSNPVKPLERGAGWVSYNGPAPDSPLESGANKLDQKQVVTVPGSLLGRSLVAQEIFDTQFLLGFAPEQPVFYLVPGNNQVTVVWDPSSTENEAGEGDPFFAVADDTASALFNSNYRQFDVEGYRVWRGTSSGSLSLIAQFDHANTEFTDVTCETVAPEDDIGNPAGPGYVAGEECPDGFSSTTNIDQDLVFNNGSAGGSPGGGMFRLVDGSSAYSTDPIVAVDSDDAGDRLPLTNTGVPFVHVDTDVINNFTYFYAVSAFDVNSPASGPHSLRSARVTQSVVPRADAPNIANADLQVGIFGDDGVFLNSNAPVPSVDSDDGTFSGPFPATNGVELSFAPLVPRLLPEFARAARIDSFIPHFNGAGECPGDFSTVAQTCWTMHLTFDTNGTITQDSVHGATLAWGAFGGGPLSGLSSSQYRLVDSEVPFDQDALDAFGIPSGSGAAVALATFDESITYSSGEGQQTRRGLVSRGLHGGSRWYSGSNETIADPAKYIQVGQLAGVTEVWAPINHTPLGPGQGTMPTSGSAQCYTYALAFLSRAADVRFTWGGGTFSEVRDVSHNLPVDFKPTAQASWGFLSEDANGNGALDWEDFQHISNVSQIFDDATGAMGFCAHTDNPATRVDLTPTPTIVPVNTDPLADPTNGGGAVTPTGMGFGLYVNGERFIFVVDALPTDGTVWTLRTHNGVVRASTASVDTDDPSGYSYSSPVDGESGRRPPTIPGLNMSFRVEAATNFDAPADLTQVHTVPDPYLGSGLYDRAPTSKQLMFVNLPPEATIRIYTLTGVLVDVLVHDDITGGGRLAWNVRNRNNQFVASGVYFFHVMTPDGDSHVGKFTVVTQAGSN